MFRENRNRYLIKTPTGYEKFAGIQKKIVPDLFTFTFTDGNYVKCSGRHQFLTNIGFLKAEQITLEMSISGKVIQKIDKEVGNFEVYDPVGVENHSTYLSNDVVSHNTEFIGSSATLISGAKLRSLAFFDPFRIGEDGHLFVYEDPKPGRIYIAMVDCSEGVGLDYHTINIVDATEAPYKQVARYRNNKLPLLFLPTVIYSIASRYNQAYVLIETNNVGQQVVDILHYDLEYENIYKLEHHHIKGQSISAGFKRSVAFGVKTTKSVKKIGCANLKTLIENDKLIINDFDTIAELNTFVRTKDSYAAEEGNNDDIVMGLVLFAWLTAQTFFKDETRIDIRKILLEEQNLLGEESVLPFGFIEDGLRRELEVEDGDMWEPPSGYLSSNL